MIVVRLANRARSALAGLWRSFVNHVFHAVTAVRRAQPFAAPAHHLSGGNVGRPLQGTAGDVRRQYALDGAGCQAIGPADADLSRQFVGRGVGQADVGKGIGVTAGHLLDKFQQVSVAQLKRPLAAQQLQGQLAAHVEGPLKVAAQHVGQRGCSQLATGGGKLTAQPIGQGVAVQLGHGRYAIAQRPAVHVIDRHAQGAAEAGLDAQFLHRLRAVAQGTAASLGQGGREAVVQLLQADLRRTGVYLCGRDGQEEPG